MKKYFLTIFTLFLCLEVFSANPEGKVKINIILKAQSDATELSRKADAFPTKAERRDFVVGTLQMQAKESQADLMNYLYELETNGLVEEIRPLWIVNSVSCYADESVIADIGNRDDILTVYQVKELQGLEGEHITGSLASDGSREIAENVTMVNAHLVWELGYTGEGVLIGLIDTGVRLTHADLQGRFWDGGAEYPNHGYDFASHDNNPTDENGHGTHVAGTICGTGASGTQTGVAPGAKLMVLKVFNSGSQSDETILVEAMQFAVEHGADLLNMSLGWPDPDVSVKHLYRQACENTLAAGVVAAVCAGNIRDLQSIVPIPRNIYSPGDCPPPYLHEDQLVNAGGTSCVISVGAVDFNDEITYFSSVGPTTWTDVALYNDYPYTPGSTAEIGLIRPDVCAPGLNIKSLDFHNDTGYTFMDGTSMATPCVAGTIALMLSKKPELTPAEIDEILERTAISSTVHKNNDYGSGRIDALAAVNSVPEDGIDEINVNNVLVYPNPSYGALFVETPYYDVSKYDYRIVNILGETVASGRITTENNRIDVSNLNNGIYFLNIGNYSQKVILYKK